MGAAPGTALGGPHGVPVGACVGAVIEGPVGVASFTMEVVINFVKWMKNE